MSTERNILILAELLIVVLLATSHPSPDCYESYGLRTKNNSSGSCSLHCSMTNVGEWKPPAKEFKLYLKDAERGVLAVEFPVPDLVTSFEVMLLMNKSATTEEECRQSNFRFPSVHSKKMFNRTHCKEADNGTNDSCKTVYLEAEMQNVFTGCYQLKVAPARIEHKRFVNGYSLSTFIKSNYKMLTVDTPNMKYDYSPIINVAFVRFNSSWIGKIPLLVSMRYAVEPEAGNQSCQARGIVQSCCSSSTPNITIQQCETSNPNHKRPSCFPNHLELVCTIYNVTPGNYCVRAEVLDDDRCAPSTVWTEDSHECVWIYDLIAKKPADLLGPEKPVEADGSNFYIYIGLGTIAALILLAAVTHGVRSLRHHLPPYEAHGKPYCNSKILAREKVLLLYAHDCPNFMELMDTFRNILRKVSACEVYDIFDPLQWNTIACGRQEWIHRLLSQDDIMIVIVDSTSAVLHQSSLENGYSINYFQPRPNSHLFTYALQIITNTVQRSVYKKIFVVRFDGFSEGQTLRHITPLRRYLLPDHLQQLLSFLKQTSCLDLEDSSLEDLKDMGDLQRQLQNLILYKAQNPDYLKNILYRTSKIV